MVIGLKPLIANEVGINVSTTQDSLQRFHPRAAVLNSTHDTTHQKRASNSYLNNFKKHKVSFPNDRARSIGPFNREDSFMYVCKTEKKEITKSNRIYYSIFRTPFTREERYNYVDPDYAYTDDERKQIEMHENAYNQLFDEQRFQRTEIKRTKFDTNYEKIIKN